MPIFVAYGRRKEVLCTNSKLVNHPKNIPALSPARTQSALRWVVGTGQEIRERYCHPNANIE
jgi:hypothetical protein